MRLKTTQKRTKSQLSAELLQKDSDLLHRKSLKMCGHPKKIFSVWKRNIIDLITKIAMLPRHLLLK